MLHSCVKTIVIVDDHAALRDGLQVVIDLEEDLAVCGSVATIEEAIEVVGRAAPDLVLTDLNLGDRDGIELIHEVRKIELVLPVLVVSMHDDSLYAERVLRAGAQGFVVKDAPLAALLEAIFHVLEGGVYVSDDTARRILDGMVVDGAGLPSLPLHCLTPRELEVFEFIGRGWDDEAIASEIDYPLGAIVVHRRHIGEKLRLRDGKTVAGCAIEGDRTQS